MNNIDLALLDPLNSYLQEQMAARGFKNPTKLVMSLLEADRMRQTDVEVEQMLTETIDGPFTDWTGSDLDEIRRLGTAIINRRKRA